MESGTSEPLIQPEDLLSLEDYERVRDERRREIIEEKRHRRVGVGELITFVFENRRTSLFQVQEMLRAESISNVDSIREEIETYDIMVPRPGELRVTMLIEIDDPEDRQLELRRLIGIEKAVAIDVGGSRVAAEFHFWRETELVESPVNFAIFRFSPELARKFADGATPVRLVISHTNYQAEAEISGPTRDTLSRELTADQQ
jgi:hypothetical protein